MSKRRKFCFREYRKVFDRIEEPIIVGLGIFRLVRLVVEILVLSSDKTHR